MSIGSNPIRRVYQNKYMHSFFIKIILTFIYLLLISSLYELYYSSFFYLKNKTLENIYYFFPTFNNIFTFFLTFNSDIVKSCFLIFLENIFLFYYIFLTFFVRYSLFKIPKILTYNILLSLTILLLHFLLFTYWNLLITQHPANKLLLHYNIHFIPETNLELYSGFFILFSFFIIILKYYLIAMQNKFPTFFPILSNSIAFWLKLNVIKNKN